MPFQLVLAPEPELNTSPEESIPYLSEFVLWLQDFFHDVAESADEGDELTGGPLFNESQIRFLEEVLEEMENDAHFASLQALVSNMDPNKAFVHGLYGSQLRWKLSNINFSLTGFLEQRTAALFDRLLSSIDALLDSILGAIPGGTAVKELKEAIRNSVAIASK